MNKFCLAILLIISILTQIDAGIDKGQIAFFNTLALDSFDPDRIVVLNIEGQTLQITTSKTNDGLTIYRIEQDFISEADFKIADHYARAFARNADPVVKQIILEEGQLIGTGNLNHSLRLVTDNSVITFDELGQFIASILNEEFSASFAHEDMTNCILTFAFMKVLNAQEILLVDNSTNRQED